MATKNWESPNNFLDGVTPYAAADIGRDNTIADMQTTGALESLGKGIYGGVGSFAVTPATGLNVSIAAGLAIAIHSVYGPCALKTENTVGILRAIPANSTGFLFAAIDRSTGNDSRVTKVPAFIFSGSNVYDGGELLAQITTSGTAVTSVVDARTLKGQSGSGSGTGAVSTLTYVLTSNSLASAATDSSKSALLSRVFVPSKITTNRAAWVRFYSSITDRTADLSRGINDDPAEGVSVALEFRTEASRLVIPVPNVTVSDSQATALGLPATIINLSGSTGTVITTIEYIALQAY